MQKIIERCKALILKPAEEFTKIKGEELSVASMFKDYALILCAITPIASFIGFTLIGVSFGLGTFRYPVHHALSYAIVTYLLSLAGIYLVAVVIDTLAPNFGSSKNLTDSFKIALFSYTPALIAGVFMIIPALSILTMLVGLYSLYLLYLGIKIIKEPPADKALAYTIISCVVLIVIYWLIGFIAGRLVYSSIAPGIIY